MRIGEALDRAMFEFKISGVGLSKDSGVGKAQISRLRNHNINMTTRNLEKIIAALPLDARIFFLGLLAGVPLKRASEGVSHED